MGADIADCFGSIDPERLVLLVERRIADGYVLALIRAWFRAGVTEGERSFRNQFGVPQGGPISPLLSNIYLHELDREWAERGYERRWGLDAKLIRYADDILIVSSKPVTERLQALLAEILGALGLTLSPDKTRLTTAAEGFDFLGFRFKRSYSRRHRREMNHFFPTPEATSRARERVRTVLAEGQGRGLSLAAMIEQLNYGLRGWTAYDAHTHASQAFDTLRATSTGASADTCAAGGSGADWAATGRCPTRFSTRSWASPTSGGAASAMPRCNAAGERCRRAA